MVDGHLGNQAANAVARETARVARATGNSGEAMATGRQYADNIGAGILNGVEISIGTAADGRIRVTVSGEAQKIAPFGVPRVSETVEGPREEFRRY